MINGNTSYIRLRIVYSKKIWITYVENDITFEGFIAEIREICQFSDIQSITVKWLDDEGDACTISSELELNEALRIYFTNKYVQILIYVFNSKPDIPGHRCPDEERSIYRKAEWKKLKTYRFHGHFFKPNRFTRNTYCACCAECIWGLGWHGLRCTNCNLHVHKRCHRQIKLVCGTAISNESPDEREEKKVNILGVMEKLYGGCEDRINNNLLIKPKIGLNDFDLLHVIGRGSYAKVFMGVHKKTKQKFAIKVIKKELLDEDDDIDWVHTEKRIFEIASNHPFLVGLHSCFQNESRLFFVIEYIGGGDLMYYMQRRNRLNEAEACFYSAEISCALNYLHGKGIIFRDLKLDNVLLDMSGHIKLTDYGMCKEGLSLGQKTGTFCGTPNYIAPEVLRGEDYDFSVDWWALGVLIYEMIVGRSPFDLSGITDHPELNTEEYLFQVILEKPVRLPRNLSSNVVAILKGFLTKSTHDRLGCNLSTGFSDIQAHIFFKTIDWPLLIAREFPPPYKPLCLSAKDIGHFDPQFINEKVCLTPDDQFTNIDITRYKL